MDEFEFENIFGFFCSHFVQFPLLVFFSFDTKLLFGSLLQGCIPFGQLLLEEQVSGLDEHEITISERRRI